MRRPPTTAYVLLVVVAAVGVGAFVLSDTGEPSDTVTLQTEAGCEADTDHPLHHDPTPSEGDGETDTMFIESSAEHGLVYSGDNDVISSEGNAVAGVYVADYNRNARQDVLLIGNDTEPVTLFCNTGDGFVVSSALPEVGVDVTSALFFDHDNDGYDDLYLLSDEGSVFLENEGGEYERQEVGLEVEYESVRGAATADYTGNGCLDVFVVQANDWSMEIPEGFHDTDVSVDDDNGNENRLFAGDCGTFTETTDEAGIHGEAWSLATSFVDLTNDGTPDIHVANDFNNDVLYLNNGDGTFDRNVMPEFTNRNGMSSEVADVTGNGYLDIFVTNIYYDDSSTVAEYTYGERVRGNNLLVNKGNGNFFDLAEEYGVRNTSGWGWAAVLDDFDNDANLDLYHAVGDDGQETQQPFWLGTGERFERVNGSASGLGTGLARPAAALDFDGDGGIDILSGVLDDRFRLYENSMERGSYLQVDVRGDGGHTELGTRVTVSTPDSEQVRVKESGTDYMSQSSRILHFGLVDAEEAEVEIERPDGTVQRVKNVSADSRVVVTPDGVHEP